ncbi:hypothetical protein DFQ27_002155 [Actinomortierella ambigua]|uniref:Yeast cell wall synthesis Kre9/Knh1-like N-terminal domain-containing protein n=1 Tax=Actinomortierella ambigua TaxID=1343610 RepID=A0A9P6U6K2_9FUNG|nr:hypothetical protein DFQ26_009380 [Actinomortierella ambigua]KAG0262736.1 hypothetical protein DFQ27_002155 [Actinomortierella ambigua]
MRFTLLATAASLMTACLVYAQATTAAYPTVPNAGTKWKAGSTVKVEWKLTDPANKTPMSIRLYHGEPTHLTEDATLGAGEAGATSAQVTLPTNLTSDWYAVRVGEDDSYSHYFIIQGTGAIPTGAPPGANSTALPTSSALPTSTLPATTTSASATASVTNPSATKPAGASPTGAAGALKAGSLAMGAAAVVAAAFAF